MNAVLAKPIHAIWFIQARKLDLHQLLAALLLAVCLSWLRDHLPLASSAGNCCVAQSGHFSARRPLRSVQTARTLTVASAEVFRNRVELVHGIGQLRQQRETKRSIVCGIFMRAFAGHFARELDWVAEASVPVQIGAR
jgi:hypothetical protein